MTRSGTLGILVAARQRNAGLRVGMAMLLGCVPYTNWWVTSARIGGIGLMLGGRWLWQNIND